MNIDFIKDEETLAIIQEIIDLAGPNFNISFDSDSQPSDGSEKNEEELIKWDLPGGTELKGMTPAQGNVNMGAVISIIAMILSPFFSAYGLLLPILAIIKAIIDVLCCLMNPFCVGDAVVRLMKKYVPAFLSIFPPVAAASIIKGIVKLIMAVTYHIMTEIVPTIQLLISTTECVFEAILNRHTEKAKACKQKLEAMLVVLLNKIGILSPIKPIVELIMLILRLIAGIPCDSGPNSSAHMFVFFAVPPFDASLSDTACCNDEQCPEEISNPPSGKGLLLRTFFGDSPPGWAWQLIPLTGQDKLQRIRPYLQDLKSQLDPQLDEPISVAVPVGATNDAAHFRLRLMGPRSETFCVTETGQTEPENSISVPIADITEFNNVIINNVRLYEYEGIVDYCVEPNYSQLVGKNILAIGCHPDIVSAKEAIKEQFGDLTERSFLDRVPELSDFGDEVFELDESLRKGQSDLGLISNDFLKAAADIEEKIENGEFDLKTPDPAAPGFRPPSGIAPGEPGYDPGAYDPGYPGVDVPAVAEEFSPALENTQDEMTAVRDRLYNGLKDFAVKQQDYLNVIVAKTSDNVLSALEVDKNLVRAGGEDKAMVYVTLRDASGTPILKNMPDATKYNVDLFTDFGTLQNQYLEKSTGAIVAELVSVFPGTASVTAKVNGDLVLTSYGAGSSVKIEKIKFVSDAILPKRRPESKSKARTGVVSEREPGSR